MDTTKPQAPLVTPQAAVFFTVLGLYLTSTPGVGPGFLDYYVIAPLLGTLQKKFSLEDFVLGDKLGEGGFGVVYRATGVDDGEDYVHKKTSDYGGVSGLSQSCQSPHIYDWSVDLPEWVY